VAAQGKLGEQRAALRGIRVLECGAGVATGFCARLFADLGAEVIKLEPGGGQRHAERSGWFAFLNAGKRTIELKPGDGARLGIWAEGADLLITDLEPATRRTQGLDLAALAAGHPKLITLRLSPLGESGPLSGQRAYGINVCALGGAAAILGEPGRPPLSFPFEVSALQAGFHGAAAALAALLARSTLGRGQHIDIAEADVLAFYSGSMALFITGSGGKWMRRGFERHGPIYPSGFYPCRDGYIFMATQTRAQWQGFLRLMGDPAWAREDPVLQDGVAIGWERADEVDAYFIPWLTRHTRRELMAMAARENLVLGPINTVADLLAEPHLVERGFWARITVDGRDLKVPGLGFRMSATPWRMGAPPAPSDDATGGFKTAIPTSDTGSSRPSGSRETAPSRPLAGYRAIEFGFNWAGPLVGQMLADLGVDVIKIETRTRLDFMRHWPHARAFFHNANRGKRSISVDIKQRAGLDLVRRLVAHTDLVFDNFAAGVMERNGLGYDALRATKPDLIVLSMAMAGQSGPLRHLRGFATIATGFAGLEAAIGYPETGPTGLPMLGLGDANAAIQAVFACLAALWYRDRSGEGQFIDLSQIEAAASLMAEPLIDLQLGGFDPTPQANRHPFMAPHGMYPAAGHERWLAIAVGSDAEWAALVGAMGEPTWACDESLARAAGRLARRDEVDARLAQWTVQHDRDALAARLQAAGVAATPLLELEEMNHHPHFRARGLGHSLASFDGGSGFVYETPWHFDRTPAGAQGPSPRLGEHTRPLLRDILGMSDSEIEALMEQKVLW
jgi:crotonobetainyl-CoA:carnitine CoA-transferase CaiB-like acyl-CoA transferase